MLGFLGIVLTVGFLSPGVTKLPTSRMATPRHALWKPEPQELLQNPGLKLAPKQETDIRRLATQWRSEKRKLLDAMSSVEVPRGRSDQVQESLQSYSELSRAYDSVRTQYWNSALSILDSAQSALVTRRAN